jgi:hypothetical protein
MTLDRLCARPGAGTALLHLHRWLPQHGAFVVNQAFKTSTMLKRLQFAAAGLTVFTVMAELSELLKAAPNAESLADRALLLMAQERGFHEVREFLTLQAAVREVCKRIDAPMTGPVVVLPGARSDEYNRTCKACLETLGIPFDWSLTTADGTPYEGSKS